MDNRLFISNVGDSRAIIASLSPDGRLVAKPLSNDQTPYRKDERERIKKYGARILSMDQLEGIEPIHENWGDLTLGEEIDEGGDPPRIWSPDGDYPGTAFTRSLGDSVAEVLGVNAEPEILEKELGPDDLFIVIASDGVFEFLTNQMVADIIFSNSDFNKGCREVVENAYEQWLQYEVRTDDITMIALHFKNSNEMRSLSTNSTRYSDIRPSTIEPQRTFSIEESKPGRRLRAKERDYRNTIISQRDTLHGTGDDYIMRPQLIENKIDSKEDEIDDNINIDYSTIPECNKNIKEIQILKQTLQKIFLFKHLDNNQIDTIVSQMRKKNVFAGEMVIKQGDPGDKFYIVQEGTYEARLNSNTLNDNNNINTIDDISSNKDGSTQSKVGSILVQTYKATIDKYPSFGELALLYDKPRAASIIAQTDGILWSIDRKVFRNSLMSKVKNRKNIIRMFRKVTVLKCVSPEKLQLLADLLEEINFKNDEFIYKKGDPIDYFYFILNGDCDVCTPPPEDNKNVGMTIIKILHKRDFFGERVITEMEGTFSRFHVIASSKIVKLLRLSRKQFESVLGPISNVIETYKLKYQKAISIGSGMSSTPTSFRNITLNYVVSSDNIGTLICGSFGSLSPNLSIRTFLLTETDEQQRSNSVLNYIDICKLITFGTHTAPNPFIPRMFTMYRLLNAFHLIFNRAIICDLQTIISRLTIKHENDYDKVVVHHNQILSNDVIQYIISCIIITISCLHELGVIYRNIHPEGIHIDNNGKLIFIEYLNSKIFTPGNKTFTLCGATNYLAPEQIAQTGHTNAVDFWSLGVLLFELCNNGVNPFHCDSEIKTYEKISSLGTNNFPSVFTTKSKSMKAKGTTSSVEDLIDSLIISNANDRLGVKNINELKSHTYFQNINWLSLQSETYTSPLIVSVKEELKEALIPNGDEPNIPTDITDNWNSAYVGNGWDEEVDITSPI